MELISDQNENIYHNQTQGQPSFSLSCLAMYAIYYSVYIM